MDQVEMLDAARREYDEDQVQPAALEVLQPGNAYLKDMVDGFLKKIRSQTNKTQITCFFELKSSNLGRIVGKQDRTVGQIGTGDTKADHCHSDLW